MVWFDRKVAEIDLSKLPAGARGWGEFLEWATRSDDSQERYFLELKSDVDLSSKRGQHKVAKFILGAANRDPVKAAKRFGGYAVMLIGVGGGRADGIVPFEAKDLEREVKKLTGAEGPGWDYEQIPVAAGRVVIAIIVDPPTGRIWPALADGDGLFNGDVYLRGDGKTEKATGAELQVMLTRVAASGASSALPSIMVDALEQALVVQYDRERLSKYVEDSADELLREIDAPKRPSPFGWEFSGLGVTERRSKEEFRREVAKWREAALAAPESGLEEIAARFAVGIRLRVVNPEEVSLRDVRVDVELMSPSALFAGKTATMSMPECRCSLSGRKPGAATALSRCSPQARSGGSLHVTETESYGLNGQFLPAFPCR